MISSSAIQHVSRCHIAPSGPGIGGRRPRKEGGNNLGSARNRVNARSLRIFRTDEANNRIENLELHGYCNLTSLLLFAINGIDVGKRDHREIGYGQT
jgi:hypothetical protein